MSGAVEIILDHPVAFKGVIYRSLTVRTPSLTDRVLVDSCYRSKFEKGVSLIALLCNVPKRVVKDLELIDLLKIDRFIAPYLGD